MDVTRCVRRGNATSAPHSRGCMGIEALRQKVVRLQNGRDIEFVNSDGDAHIEELRPFDNPSASFQKI